MRAEDLARESFRLPMVISEPSVSRSPLNLHFPLCVFSLEVRAPEQLIWSWEAVAHRVTSCRTSTLVERFKIHKHLSQERIMTPEKELTLIFTFSNFLFFIFWLCWVFFAACGLPPIAAHRLLTWRLLSSRGTGSREQRSAAAAAQPVRSPHTKMEPVSPALPGESQPGEDRKSVV